MTAARQRLWSTFGRCTALDLMALAAIFSCSFAKFFIEPAGKLAYSTILAGIFTVWFLGARLRDRDGSMPRELMWLIAAAAGITAVYLLGWFNIPDPDGRLQFLKGFVTWIMQAGFMVTLAWHVWRRGAWMFQMCAGALLAGITVNAVYGLAQFVLIVMGINLDQYVVTPLTLGQGKDAGAHLFGAGIYRINGLMRDVNHLGVTAGSGVALAIGWLHGRQRIAVAGTNFLALVFTLSRSGALALMAGLGTLGVLRRHSLSPAPIIGTFVAAALAVGLFALAAPDLYTAIVGSRLNTQGSSAQTHLQLYSVIPIMLDQHPVAGLGLNTFALEFESLVGRDSFGPHSYFIQVSTETGVAGVVITAAWIIGAFRFGLRARQPVVIGLVAALAATLAGNLFYLTAHLIIMKIIIGLAYIAPAIYTSGRIAPDPHADRIQTP